jgi:hypothetical protein
MCEHFTYLDTYRLLIGEWGHECSFAPSLVGTSWVQNYMTSESCKECEREAGSDFEE